MYADKLLNAYKNANKYVQDKQIAHDLNLEPNKISKIRKGVRQLTDNEALFLAEGAGIEPEVALLGCHADRNDNPEIKAIWQNIAKKFNGQGLQGLSLSLVAVLGYNIAVTVQHSKFALCILC
ncbi:MAG: hypothetical protein JKY55_01185 [Aliivibrio sp.]|uniref:DUF3693 domain-containing protein n=1 Tax=Aliivibrio sp. TaxID=1872443 RepID=UPI001A55DB62|nr:hypothetical protein [Aliivibrio sp.]